MPPFKNGTHLNRVRLKSGKKCKPYIRISSGPQRGEYVHKMIWLAYHYGLLEGLGNPAISKVYDDIEAIRAGILTIDHKDGNTLNNDIVNLEAVTQSENTRRMQERNGIAKKTRKKQ